jgi:polar amino acid transport system substrate-binding protein
MARLLQLMLAGRKSDWALWLYAGIVQAYPKGIHYRHRPDLQASDMRLIVQAPILLWLLLIALAAPAMARPYQLVSEEWAPYNYLENGQVTGMTSDIVRAIMALTGDAFPMTLQPSLRSVRTLDTQPGTIMFSLFRTAQREPLYKWVGPIVEESIYPYQLASSPPVNSLTQLHSAPKITTRHGGLIPAMLKDQGFDNLDTSAGNNVQLYDMLMAGRTPIIVGDTPAGVAYYRRRLNIAPGAVRQIPVELYRSSLYIAFSLDCEDSLVAAWARALEQLRHSGELERIRRQYVQDGEQ